MVDLAQIVAGNMSANITPTVNCSAQMVKTIGAHFVWTGTPTGVFKVDASNFDSDYLGATSTWADVTALISPAIAAPAGSAGTAFANLSNLGFKYLRVRYVATSGAGSLNVNIYGKED